MCADTSQEEFHEARAQYVIDTVRAADDLLIIEQSGCAAARISRHFDNVTEEGLQAEFDEALAATRIRSVTGGRESQTPFELRTVIY